MKTADHSYSKTFIFALANVSPSVRHHRLHTYYSSINSRS